MISNLLERIDKTPESESRRSSQETSDLGGEDDPWNSSDLLTRLDKQKEELKNIAEDKRNQTKSL